MSAVPKGIADERSFPAADRIATPERLAAAVDARLSAPAADDARRPAAGKPRDLPAGRDLRRQRQRAGDEAAVLAERESPQGHPFLHQFARRQRHRDAGDLRHDADDLLPGGDLLRRPGGQRRGGAVGRRREGQTVRPAARQGDDPPAARRRRRPGLRHRDSGQRNRPHADGAERNPRRPYRQVDRRNRQGHATATTT